MTMTERHDKNRIIGLAQQLLAPAYSRPETVFVGGAGATLEDTDGRRYLDMTSGIGVSCLGHNSPVVREAIREASEQPLHVSNLYHSVPGVELAQLLVERSFADSVFYANSGAEAIEAALKLARLGNGEGRRGIVYFDGSFHGRTMGALAATDRPAHREPFEPLPQGFTRAPWDSPDALGLIDARVAAVIVEPIQGEKGVRPAGARWLEQLRERCDEVGALLIFDEVQCGVGRTGHLWAHEATRARPDIMTAAKPLAGGLPIGAVLMTSAVAARLSPGLHGTTFGGGPFVTAVARRIFQTVSDPRFLGTVRERGRTLRARLEELGSSPLVAEIRGAGLMLGLRLHDLEPKELVTAAHTEGLLVVPSADNVVRLLPPLNVTNEEIALAADKLGAALHALKRS